MATCPSSGFGPQLNQRIYVNIGISNQRQHHRGCTLPELRPRSLIHCTPDGNRTRDHWIESPVYRANRYYRSKTLLTRSKVDN